MEKIVKSVARIIGLEDTPRSKHSAYPTEKPCAFKLKSLGHDRNLPPGSYRVAIDSDRLRLYKVIDMAG